MAPQTSRVGGLLAAYLNLCVLVGALWVGIARRELKSTDERQDLEALVGGMMIFGVTSAAWFGIGRPLIELGPVGDSVEGFALGLLVGFVVTGVALAIRVWTETTTGT